MRSVWGSRMTVVLVFEPVLVDKAVKLRIPSLSFVDMLNVRPGRVAVVRVPVESGL